MYVLFKGWLQKRVTYVTYVHDIYTYLLICITHKVDLNIKITIFENICEYFMSQSNIYLFLTRKLYPMDNF